MSVKIKGSFVEWCPKEIYITSNVNPEDWYKDAPLQTRRAIARRLDVINHVQQPLFDDIEMIQESTPIMDLSFFGLPLIN
jgi:hypothetical protein